MKRQILAVMLVFSLVFALGCAAPAPDAQPATEPTIQQPEPPAQTEAPGEEPQEAPDEDRPVQVATLKGPTGMGMALLMEMNEAGESKQPYGFTIASAPDEIVGRFVTGEVQIAAVPINLAGNLYAKTQGDVAIIAVNTLGVLYVLENGTEIQSVADLAGKTLYATGQGSTPEFIINYLLEKNGVAGQVEIEYMMEHADLASLLAAGERTLGMLPEPNVTSVLLKNPDVRIALDLTKEWDAAAGGAKLVQGCIIARRYYIEENPDSITNFLSDYMDSVTFVNSDNAAAGALIEKFEILPSAAAATKAIPNCNIVCLTGEEMRESAKAMFEVLYAANPASVGGELPPDAIYYMP